MGPYTTETLKLKIPKFIAIIITGNKLNAILFAICCIFFHPLRVENVEKYQNVVQATCCTVIMVLLSQSKVLNIGRSKS